MTEFRRVLFRSDYEIENPGTYYHDPTLADSAITYQYCVLPINYTFPNIPSELLYHVYLPEAEGAISGRANDAKSQLLIDMEYEAVRLTGNLSQSGNSGGRVQALLPSRWTPKGTITVWDDFLGRQIPVEGAEVHARWFTNIATAITDANGYFSTSQFRYEVNYAIKWERGHYDIRNGLITQAWYNGPKQKGDWNLDIAGGESLKYAHIHRGAHKYFYGNTLGLARPINDGKSKISLIDGNKTGMYWGEWGSNILPDILIWSRWGDGTYKSTEFVFGTTMHELAHQAHYLFIGNVQFIQVSGIVFESWADAVEWAMANDEYRNLGIRYSIPAGINYFHAGNSHDFWPTRGDRDYSPIFIDLMDVVNQRDRCLGCPNDLVSGYTPATLNWNILLNAYGLSSLRDQVKNNKPAGVTDAQIDELFTLYW